MVSGSQVCGKPVTSNMGKVLRPPDNSRVILYLKDINLPRCSAPRAPCTNPCSPSRTH